MDRMAPGGGGRFAALVHGGMSPALAAYIGRKKYGGAKFAQMSASGRKRHAKKHHTIARQLAAHKSKGGVIDPDGIPNNGDEYRIVNGRKVPVRPGH